MPRPVPSSCADRTAGVFIAAILVGVIQAHGFGGYDAMKRALVDPAIPNWELVRAFGVSIFQARVLRQRVDLVFHLENTPLSPVRTVQEKIRKATARRRIAHERKRA